MRQYRLDEKHGWAIDLDHLENQITTATRAIVLISPHNPTGMVADEEQLRVLAEIATRHSLPIVSDEVFSEFLFGMNSFPRPAATGGSSRLHTERLFEDVCAARHEDRMDGRQRTRGGSKKAVAALELISDTFLPVNEIAQFAAPRIFDRGGGFLSGYKEWIARCRHAAVEGLKGCTFAAARRFLLNVTDRT